MERKSCERLAVLGLVVLAQIFIFFPDILGSPACEEELLCVVFLDVGQGDSIFIQSPSGTQMLIDGGRDSSVLRELSAVMQTSDRSIDYLLMTHPDSDHVGGLIEVFERYQIASLIRTNNINEGPVGDLLAKKEANEKATTYIARRGQLIDLGAGVALEILFPDRDVSQLESNTASVVAKVTYGDHSFMLTGDAPKSIEEYLVLTHGETLESTVLKVGHHGSRTSTSALFLAHVRPQVGVISAGADNQYGHPHEEVVESLVAIGVELYQTGEDGRVVFHSDGTTLSKK